MELKWSFILYGNYPYLHQLLHYLDSEDITIYEEGDEQSDLTQYFSSVHFNHLTEPDDIYSKAYQLCSFVNAIEFLIQENKENCNSIRLDRLINIEENTNVHYDKSLKVNRVDIDFSTNKTTKTEYNHIISQTILVAKSDEFVQNLLFMISQGMDFQRMYQVLDEIKYFLKSNSTSLEDIGFSKKGALNNFTHTANNYQALGLRARHGNQGLEPPQTPMTLPDAQALLTDIVKAIFNQFYGIEFPIIKDISFDISDLFDE